jgi:hypothetical protein
MTPADITYRRRVRVIERAAEVGVTAACREAGVSRKSYYGGAIGRRATASAR